MILAAGCAASSPDPSPDPCAWVGRIGTQSPIVRGETLWHRLVDELKAQIDAARDAARRGEDYDADAALRPILIPRDILTQRTAGRIVAHDTAVIEFCGETEAP